MGFKVFRQLEGMDCGPACIQMVSFYYGKRVSIYKLRDLCNVTRLGVCGDDIVSGCQGLKLTAIPCMVDQEKLKSSHCQQLYIGGKIILLYYTI